MKHLTDTEFVDILDWGAGGTQREPGAAGGGLPSDRLHHLDVCDACRTQADALRAILAEAAADEAPQPSPLFWDFFAARVSAAIRDEALPSAPSPSVPPWRRHPLAEWAIAASIAVVVMLTVVWRATLHAPAPASPPTAITAVSGQPQPAIVDPATATVAVDDDVENDEAWAVVRSAAEGFRWEDAHAVGISAGPGAAEGLALELTADERAALARLIDSEMKRSGA